GTMKFGLHYKRGSLVVDGYSDADWAKDRDRRRSTTGFVFLMNGTAISWKSRLQPTVATSSVEAEYMAAAFTTCEALWIRKLLYDLGMEQECVRIWDDNQGALSLIKNPVSSERSRHIDVAHHFVRERTERGEVKFDYCPTESMVADVMTKPLADKKFAEFRTAMGVR
ncbi:hypothetical protein VaNZ11_010446, partial [Volvox africanus]